MRENNFDINKVVDNSSLERELKKYDPLLVESIKEILEEMLDEKNELSKEKQVLSFSFFGFVVARYNKKKNNEIFNDPNYEDILYKNIVEKIAEIAKILGRDCKDCALEHIALLKERALRPSTKKIKRNIGSGMIRSHPEIEERSNY